MLSKNLIEEKNKELINQIRTVFYNDLINLALDETDVSLDNIDQKISNKIMSTIINILDLSKSYNAISLGNGIQLTEKTCPLIYHFLLKKLLEIKLIYDLVPSHQVNEMKNDLLDCNTYLVKMIKDLSISVMKTEYFQEMIPKVKQFILEAKGLIGTVHDRIALDETEVTIHLIRDTFYNEMVIQALNAINAGLIKRDDLESQDVSIYFALPALTLLEAINQSQNYEGIKLLNNKILTLQNCPKDENFNELLIPILQAKDQMKKLTENELQVIKFLCLSNQKELPEKYIGYKTQQATQSVALINKISSIVSQREFFKRIIKDVISMCLESLAQKNQK